MAKGNVNFTGVRAVILAPFFYHGLYVPDGSATDPTILSDTTVMFALAHSMGCPPTEFPRSRPEYAKDIAKLAWKSSLFVQPSSASNRVMPPIRHTLDMEREGGYQEKLQKGMRSGNVKKFWWVHEVALGSCYEGAVYGPNPFEVARMDTLVIRVGVGRLGIVRLEQINVPEEMRLNAATARLFGQTLTEEYRILDTIRVSRAMNPVEAAEVVSTWSVSD